MLSKLALLSSKSLLCKIRCAKKLASGSVSNETRDVLFSMIRCKSRTISFFFFLFNLKSPLRVGNINNFLSHFFSISKSISHDLFIKAALTPAGF